jgi:predicted small secreted protein
MKKISLVVAAAMLAAFAFAQDNTVQVFGKVFDKDMKPIENVTIALKNTKFKTITNGEGSYFFMLPTQKGILVFSRAGYQIKENKFTGTPQATDLILSADKKKKKSK